MILMIQKTRVTSGTLFSKLLRLSIVTFAVVIGAPGQIEQRTAKAYRCRISRHLAQRLTNAIDRHPSRLAQFDAQLMMVAHDHDVPSTAGPRLQAGRDRLDQIHDRMAHHHPIVFTQVSHGHCHI
jgi:hypothetical protein